MVVEAAISALRVILTGVKQRVSHELDIVDQGFSVGGLDLVVPVHHDALVAGVNGIVVDIFLHIHGVAAHSAFQLRVLLIQQVIVHQINDKQVAGLLNIGNSGFPEQFQQVDFPDVDVSQAVILGGVPEHAIGGGSMFQLLPPVVGVGLLEVVALQNDREDGGQNLCAFLVAALSRQGNRLREVVHSVRVLVHNAVEKPCAGRLRAVRVQGRRVSVRVRYGAPAVFGPSDGFPVAQLPPKLVLHNALFQVCLAGFVLRQDFRCPLNILFSDNLLIAAARHEHGCHIRRKRLLVAGYDAG